MTDVFLGLGSNLGRRMRNLEKALKILDTKAGTLTALSPVYESRAVGFTSVRLFLNMCASLKTGLKAPELMELLLETEALLGRQRSGTGSTDRSIDLDILLYGNNIIREQSLVIPHPRMHLRYFVMRPLADIAGQVKHPLLKESMSALAERCGDKDGTRRYSGAQLNLKLQGHV